jgi:sulfur relay (sulfurtransferase) DsrF/TusC family protein
MGLKVLNIVESAYRATIEEQDDTILWTSSALKGAGADVDVLLRGNAVNYGVRGQDASGLQFGARKQTHPPQIEDDLQRLMDMGAKVYVTTDDAAERGLERTDLIGGLEPISRSRIAKLCADYDQIWHW